MQYKVIIAQNQVSVIVLAGCLLLCVIGSAGLAMFFNVTAFYPPRTQNISGSLLESPSAIGISLGAS